MIFQLNTSIISHLDEDYDAIRKNDFQAKQLDISWVNEAHELHHGLNTAFNAWKKHKDTVIVENAEWAPVQKTPGLSVTFRTIFNSQSITETNIANRCFLNSLAAWVKNLKAFTERLYPEESKQLINEFFFKNGHGDNYSTYFDKIEAALLGNPYGTSCLSTVLSKDGFIYEGKSSGQERCNEMDIFWRVSSNVPAYRNAPDIPTYIHDNMIPLYHAFATISSIVTASGKLEFSRGAISSQLFQRLSEYPAVSFDPSFFIHFACFWKRMANVDDGHELLTWEFANYAYRNLNYLKYLPLEDDSTLKIDWPDHRLREKFFFATYAIVDQMNELFFDQIRDYQNTLMCLYEDSN